MMRRIGKRTGLAVAATALAIALAIPASAPAATTVLGRVQLTGGLPSNSSLCGVTCTDVQVGSSSAAQFVGASPVDGTVTSWSLRTPSTPMGSVYALRIVRSVAGGKFVVVGTSNNFTVPDTTDKVRGPFTTSIPLKKGDLIGMVANGNAPVPTFGSTSASDTYDLFYGANSLSDNGPPMSPSTNPPLTNQQIAIQATITFTTPPPGCPPNCPPPPPGAGKPSLSAFSVSPKTFRSASRGASVARTRRRVIPIGTKVSYTLSQAATTTFTLQRRTTGRRVNGRCVAPRRSNRTRRRCSRYVNVSGSFSRAGAAGANSFKFTGRLRGRKLSPGTYKVTAVASNANGKSSSRTTTFTIVS